MDDDAEVRRLLRRVRKGDLLARGALLAHTSEALRRLGRMVLRPALSRGAEADALLRSALVGLYHALDRAPRSARHFYGLAALQMRQALADLPGPHPRRPEEGGTGHYADCLDCVCANLDRRVGADPPWLTGTGRAVAPLARDIHAGGRYELMPVLADALEDAGCDQADVLSHCRQPAPHAPGCWVLELLLGAEAGVGGRGSEERLAGLLLRWEERYARGRDLPAEALCPGRPDLARELGERIRVAKQLAWLNPQQPY
jgi:hypothetical protein